MDQELFPELPLLVVDDERDFLNSLDYSLRSNGITNVECCRDSRDVMPRLKEKKFAVILLDLLMPDISGEELLPDIVEQYPEIPVIIVTAHADTELARECMQKGAINYLMKPFETKDLVRKIKDALYLKDFQKEIITLKKAVFSDNFQKPKIFPDITSRSEKMHKIFQDIVLNAVNSTPILVQGEAGVGKKFLAMEIHKQSHRQGKFIEFNTAGMDDNSFAHILLDQKKGLLEEARDGTLLLNEIANLPVQSQSKLYHLIREWEYLPPGSDKPVATNVRIIAATKKNLSALIRTNDFRHELYSLLRANDINIPPLREHREDMPLLVDYFVNQAAEKRGIKTPKAAEGIYSLLEQYDFPGNISELKNMVYEAVNRHTSGDLSLDVFWGKIKNQYPVSPPEFEIPVDKKYILESVDYKILKT